MAEASYGLTTFSPSGKLVQIEYATTAAGNGATTLGIRAVDGVVLAAEKKVQSSLVDPSSIQKVFELDLHAGCTYSGIGPDCRVIISYSRKVCQQYRMTYNEPIPIGQLVRKMASLFQEYTQSGGVRPFGCQLLVCGKDQSGYHLYQVDPSGTFWAWKATSIGKHSGNAKTFLEKRYAADGELEDAVHTALLTLKEGFDGKMTAENTEVGRVTSDGRFEVLNSDQLKDYLEQI